MEKKYESLSIFEFQERFPDEDSCYKYLADLKWKDGFKCRKCGHWRYSKGQAVPYTRKCTRCDFQESPTSQTLFHKVKFSILKAFYIVYYVSTSKKGVASTELSRRLSLRQKTCWLFKRKVMEAMKSSGNFPIKGIVEVDETFVGGKQPVKRGRSYSNKLIVAFAVETKGKGISRAYGKVIQHAGVKELRPFIEHHIAKDAQITTDKWRGYTPLLRDYPNLRQIPSAGGKNFEPIHRFIMGFKSWLRGIHHTTDHLQAYVDEYTYRFNRHFMKEGIFENLLRRMIQHNPVSYQEIKLFGS